MKKRILFVATIVITVIIFILGISLEASSPSRRIKKHLELGQKYLTELDYEQAVASFKEALIIDPDNSEAVSGITLVYVDWSSELVSQQSYEAAIAKIDEARILLPDNQELIDKEVNIYLEWTSDYEKSGNIEKAIDILQIGYGKTRSQLLQNKIDEYKAILEQAAGDEETTSPQDEQGEGEPDQLFRLVEGYYKDPHITLREYISYEGENIVDSTAYTRYVFEPTDVINEYRNYDREGYVAIITLTGDDAYTYQLREVENNASELTLKYKYFGQTVWG